MEVSRLKGATGLRCWAAPEKWGTAILELLEKANLQNLTPSAIVFYAPEGEDREWQIILWGD